MTTQKTVTPIDGSVYVERPLAGRAELDAALDVAKTAQVAWRAKSLEERAEALGAFVDAVVADKARLAEELTWQMGRPIAQTPGEIGGFEERARTMIQLLTSSGQVTRMKYITRQIFVRSFFRAAGDNPAYRREEEVDSLFMGEMHLTRALLGDASQPSTNLHLVDVHHYHDLPNGVSNVMAGSTGSTANGVTVHLSGGGPTGPIDIGPATGSDNTSVPWDGTTLPDASDFGADH